MRFALHHDDSSTTPRQVDDRGVEERPVVTELLRDGHSNSRISRELRCDKPRVARIRAELGLPAYVQQPLTLEQKWRSFTSPIKGGHLEWTGERGRSAGTPVMRYKEQSYSPAAVAFGMRHDREPVGHVFAECGFRHCVAPDHVDDEPGRTRTREQLRYIMGGQARKPFCPRSHDQSVHGRYEPDGTASCEACKAERKRAQRKAVAS